MLAVEEKYLSAATRLPAQDLDRARRWYLEKLGVRPTEERPGGLRMLVVWMVRVHWRPGGQSVQLVA